MRLSKQLTILRISLLNHMKNYLELINTQLGTALALHIARRCFNERPETPIHALRVLRDRGLLTVSECDKLEKLIRSRNLLMHRYWVVDDRRIYDNVKNDFKSVLNLIDRPLFSVVSLS